MRHLFLFLFLLFNYLNLPAYAQDTTLFYFPLQIGDRWEYTSSRGTVPLIVQKEVTGDTLMPDGLQYKKIRISDPMIGVRYEFQRIQDSTKIYVRPQNSCIGDTLFFQLDLYAGKEWSAWPEGLSLHVDSIYQSQFLGRELAAALITRPEASFGILQYIIVDSLGIYFVGFEGGFEILNGAIVNGVNYGILTNLRNAKFSDELVAHRLEQNYPNPFNHETILEYTLARSDEVELIIFNTFGQIARHLVDEYQNAGTHRIRWNGKDDDGLTLPSGVYYYSLKFSKRTIRKKLLFVK